MYGDSISETRKIMNSVVQLNSVDEFITEQLFCSELVAFHKMVVYIYVPSLISPPLCFYPPLFLLHLFLYLYNPLPFSAAFIIFLITYFWRTITFGS